LMFSYINYMYYFYIKGTIHRDFLLPIFVGMGSSQAPYSVFEGFSNLSSNRGDIRVF
jgi:hypothetical protein